MVLLSIIILLVLGLDFINGFGIVDTVSKVVLTDIVGDGRMIYVVFAGVVAAIVWSLLTWWFGTSSHTLIGGFAGAAIATGGWGVSVELVTAWIITIPVSAVMGMATYWLVALFL